LHQQADLEKQFHKYFFSGVHEKKITDLVRLKQRNDESVESFVQRLREGKNKCYSLVLDDRELAELAFQGLLPHIRDKYASQEFESLSHLVQRISNQDIKPFEPKRAWNKKVSFVDEAASSDSDEEPVIGLAEWVKIRSRCLVLLGIKSHRSSHLTPLRPIGYLTSYFRKVKSNCHPIM